MEERARLELDSDDQDAVFQDADGSNDLQPDQALHGEAEWAKPTSVESQP